MRSSPGSEQRRQPPRWRGVVTASSLVALSCNLACASNHDTGEALVATGALVALASSQAATRQVGCVQAGCAGQTSRRAGQAAAGVAAGVALAALGAALEKEDPGDAVRGASPPPAGEPGSWRLVRKADDAEEAPAYYIEE